VQIFLERSFGLQTHPRINVEGNVVQLVVVFDLRGRHFQSPSHLCVGQSPRRTYLEAW
jgi:hypothetical protein